MMEDGYFWYYSLGMWTRQTLVIALWSLLCFFLGMAFCAGLYVYRIRRAMRKAARKVEELARAAGLDYGLERRQTDLDKRSVP